MAWKQTGQLSLADSLINAHKAIEELDELHNLIDWQTIEQTLYATFIAVSVGNLPFTPVIMFKVLLYKNSITYRIQPWKQTGTRLTVFPVALLAYH